MVQYLDLTFWIVHQLYKLYQQYQHMCFGQHIQFVYSTKCGVQVQYHLLCLAGQLCHAKS